MGYFKVRVRRRIPPLKFPCTNNNHTLQLSCPLSVIDMSYMFTDAESFNGDLSTAPLGIGTPVV